MALVFRQLLIKNRLLVRLMILMWQQRALVAFVLRLLFAVNEVLLS